MLDPGLLENLEITEEALVVAASQPNPIPSTVGASASTLSLSRIISCNRKGGGLEDHLDPLQFYDSPGKRGGDIRVLCAYVVSLPQMPGLLVTPLIHRAPCLEQ